MTKPLTMRAQALAAYQHLREANPDLPPASQVVDYEPITMSFGPDHQPVLTLTVAVNLPPRWTEIWGDGGG